MCFRKFPLTKQINKNKQNKSSKCIIRTQSFTFVKHFCSSNCPISIQQSNGTIWWTFVEEKDFVQEKKPQPKLDMIIGGSRGGRCRRPPPNRIQFFHFRIHFCQTVPTLKVGAPPNGKFWIRHWWLLWNWQHHDFLMSKKKWFYFISS